MRTSGACRYVDKRLITKIYAVNNALVFSIAAGIFFGSWPLIARFANLSSFWVAFFIPFGTILLVALAWAPKFLTASSLSWRAVLVGLLAGACNGLGMLFYGQVISRADWDVSKYVPLVAIVSIAAAAVGAFTLFREPITIQKIAGLVLAAVAVWLLS